MIPGTLFEHMQAGEAVLLMWHGEHTVADDAAFEIGFQSLRTF